MRVPLSWLRDFAPFEGDPADIAATLDDLGLVVEVVEHVGEGLGEGDVVLFADAATDRDDDRRSDLDRPGGGLPPAGQDVEQRRLARPVGPDDADPVAGAEQ